MLFHALLALCGATAVIAQTTAGSPLLSQFGAASDYQISTAGSDATHTTYIINCIDRSSPDCAFPPTGATLIEAPSSIAYFYSYEQVTVSVGCSTLASGSSAACVMSEGGPGLSYLSASGTFLSSFTVPASEIALGFNTAGATGTTGAVTATGKASAGLSATAVTAVATTTGGTTLVTATGSATGSATGTTSGSGSATGTAAAASTTSTAKTGGAVKGCGGINTRWVVGALVVGLGLIL